ncbi:UNVERIFIED_CONTAM: protein HEADING DATE REPRESSOR 1 [Sesamum angustifolium]|uniref:Protein HEADING DATE REPRESSOR 1 n=1 Tax=Sesamum angustifolium TaxID=2727405 RepID=A0AAW2LIR8_9LAMI
MKNIDTTPDGPTPNKFMEKQQASSAMDVSDVDKPLEKQQESSADDKQQEPNTFSTLSEKRKALFEPLEPVININGKRPSAESLLPPPDFESASYPRGWLIGQRNRRAERAARGGRTMPGAPSTAAAGRTEQTG